MHSRGYYHHHYLEQLLCCYEVLLHLFDLFFLKLNVFFLLAFISYSKGISASALPYKRTPPSWLKISSQDVRNPNPKSQLLFFYVVLLVLLESQDELNFKALPFFIGILARCILCGDKCTKFYLLTEFFSSNLYSFLGY